MNLNSSFSGTGEEFLWIAAIFIGNALFLFNLFDDQDIPQWEQ